MPKRVVDLGGAQLPLLDIASYGRCAPSASRSLTPMEISYIRRTVTGVPEVMVKVSGGARSLRGVRTHFDYIGREGRGVMEMDDGDRIQRKGFEKALVEDWDLDLDAQRRHTQRTIAAGRRRPRLVYNLVFSMPKGTPADKLQRAVRVFAREKFAHRHRYAMTLHTDQGHPHVHMVVRAMGEEGERLNIRKATLREWRRDFAHYLRELGIAANATERAVRGEVRSRKTDGIHRAMMRGESFHHSGRIARAARLVEGRDRPVDPGKQRMANTRRQVVNGWYAVAKELDEQAQGALAQQIRRFVGQMPQPRTEIERLADRLEAGARRETSHDRVRTR